MGDLLVIGQPVVKNVCEHRLEQFVGIVQRCRRICQMVKEERVIDREFQLIGEYGFLRGAGRMLDLWRDEEQTAGAEGEALVVNESGLLTLQCVIQLITHMAVGTQKLSVQKCGTVDPNQIDRRFQGKAPFG